MARDASRPHRLTAAASWHGVHNTGAVPLVLLSVVAPVEAGCQVA